jgi:hypothetical protein
MILFSIGPFGPFAAWWDAAIARIAEIGLGPTAIAAADAPEDLAPHLIRSAAPNIVVVTRRPGPPLRALLAESGAPVLVGLGDPREGLFELIVGRGIDFHTATHLVADSCAAAIICAAMPRGVVVSADAARQHTSEMLGRIAQSCGLDIAPAATGIAAPPDPAIAAREWWGALDPDVRGIAEGAFRGYATWLAGNGVGETTWDRRLFCRGADHGRSAGAAIDIGGTPGVLVDGPWIGLPPGHWAASVTLAVSREVKGGRFDITIHAAGHHTELARGSIICDGRGFGSATLLFAVEPACGHTISFTVASTAPAPGGRLAMGNVVLAPSSSEAVGIPAELSSALSLN